jgi:integrase/recombinase XerC
MPSVQERVSSYLGEIESANTRAQAARAILHFMAFVESVGETLAWNNWDTLLVREWKSYLQNVKKVAPATVNVYLSMVSSYANWCVREGYLPRNPVSGVKKIKLAKKDVRALSRKEQLALMRAVDGEKLTQDRFILMFLIHTGLRAQEFVDLTLDDILLGEREKPLSQWDPKVKPGAIRTGKVVVIGKGQKQREVPLNATARRALLEWMTIRPKTDDKHLLISRKFLKPMSTDVVEYTCQKYRRIIHDLHPHILRKTCATNMAKQGVGVEIIADVLGHSSVGTTIQYYVEPRRKEKAVEVIAYEELTC